MLWAVPENSYLLGPETTILPSRTTHLGKETPPKCPHAELFAGVHRELLQQDCLESPTGGQKQSPSSHRDCPISTFSTETTLPTLSTRCLSLQLSFSFYFSLFIFPHFILPHGTTQILFRSKDTRIS